MNARYALPAVLLLAGCMQSPPATAPISQTKPADEFQAMFGPVADKLKENQQVASASVLDVSGAVYATVVVRKGVGKDEARKIALDAVAMLMKANTQDTVFPDGRTDFDYTVLVKSPGMTLLGTAAKYKTKTEASWQEE